MHESMEEVHLSNMHKVSKLKRYPACFTLVQSHGCVETKSNSKNKEEYAEEGTNCTCSSNTNK